jgi:hypothetical protein
MAVLGELGLQIAKPCIEERVKILYGCRSWRVTAVNATLKRKSNRLRPEKNLVGTDSNT